MIIVMGIKDNVSAQAGRLIFLSESKYNRHMLRRNNSSFHNNTVNARNIQLHISKNLVKLESYLTLSQPSLIFRFFKFVRYTNNTETKLVMA